MSHSARATGSTAAAASPSPHANDALPCDTVVLDGANLAWTFSASLFAKHGCRTRLPLSRGLTLALESDVWRDLRVKPVAFMPESYVEGPLHGLADGGSLETLVPENVAYLGDGKAAGFCRDQGCARGWHAHESNVWCTVFDRFPRKNRSLGDGSWRGKW